MTEVGEFTGEESMERVAWVRGVAVVMWLHREK